MNEKRGDKKKKDDTQVKYKTKLILLKTQYKYNFIRLTGGN
jgi:hypothetical protein